MPPSASATMWSYSSIRVQSQRSPDEHPFASTAGAEPHRPPHVGGDVVRARRARHLPRLLDEPEPLRVLVEGDPEAMLDDLRGPPARERVRERVLRSLEQLEQLPVDGDVEARELRVERLDLVARWLRGDLGHPNGSCDFTRVKLKRGGVGRGRTVHLVRDFTRVKLKAAEPVPALGTGPRPAPRLEPTRIRSPAKCEAAFRPGRFGRGAGGARCALIRGDGRREEGRGCG
jgi:hypothetical protein